MDDDAEQKPVTHGLGDDLSRLSVAELKTLHAALMDEAARVAAEMEAKAQTRSAADAFFKPKG